MLETYEKTLKYLLEFSQKYSVSSLPNRTYPELEKLDFEDYEILEELSVIKFKKYKYHSPENPDFLITILPKAHLYFPTKNKENIRWLIPIIISVLALIVSIIALFLGIKL